MSAELSQLIRDVAQSAPADATPTSIAEAVIEKAGETLAGEFLLELLANEVRLHLGGERRDALGGSSVARSPKLERRRNWWARTLDTRVAVGDGNWKRLGDCTIADLRYCIAERQDLIDRTRKQIDNYESIIASMEKHKVKRVSDLSAEQVNL